MNSPEQRAFLYLHGFRSSSASAKVGIFRRWLAQCHPDLHLEAPDLPPEPLAVTETIRSALERLGTGCLGVVGSSLGGYYACWSAVEYAMPAVLINPALAPYDLFEAYLGEHTNLYTGERFTLKREYLGHLREIDRVSQLRPHQALLLTQTADETLEARDAWRRLPAGPCWITGGGSHAFDRFDRVLPAIVAFLKPKGSFNHESENPSV